MRVAGVMFECSCLTQKSCDLEKNVPNKRLTVFICGSFVRCRVVALANMLNICALCVEISPNLFIVSVCAVLLRVVLGFVGILSETLCTHSLARLSSD